MSRNLLAVCTFFVLATLVLQVYSQDACQSLRVDGSMLGSTNLMSSTGLISDILAPGGDTSVQVGVRIMDTNVVCEAQQIMKDSYRYTSVAVSFTCASTDPRVPQCMDNTLVHTEQFDLGCSSGVWTPAIFTINGNARTANPTATLMTELDTDCILCINPTHPAANATSVDSVTHCQECFNCPIGLQRCYYVQNNMGNDVETCCNYFHNGVCVIECPMNFAPYSNFECLPQCPAFTVENGVINYENVDRFVNTTATLRCNNGYEAVSGIETICLSNSSWVRPNDLECQPISCGSVGELENGQISYSNEMRVVGSTVSFECNNGFFLEGGESRTCLLGPSWSGTNPSCTPCGTKIDGCSECVVDKNGDSTCTVCEGGNLPVDGKCEKPTPAPGTGSSCNTACIIGIILAIIAVVIIGTVVAVVAFVLYKYLNDPATKLATTGTGGLNGVARDNPLYVDPAAVTDEGIDGVPTETTPLEA